MFLFSILIVIKHYNYDLCTRNFPLTIKTILLAEIITNDKSNAHQVTWFCKYFFQISFWKTFFRTGTVIWFLDTFFLFLDPSHPRI